VAGLTIAACHKRSWQENDQCIRNVLFLSLCHGSLKMINLIMKKPILKC